MTEMKHAINLQQYKKLGGVVENLDPAIIHSSYQDKNQYKKIKSFKEASSNGKALVLYEVEFQDGAKHKYAETWLMLSPDFVLAKKYRAAGEPEPAWINIKDTPPPDYERVIYIDDRDKAQHIGYFVTSQTKPMHTTWWQPCPKNPPGLYAGAAPNELKC